MKRLINISPGFLLAMMTLTSQAATVYTWIDTAGVTHFSESPPLNAPADAQQIDLQPAPDSDRDSIFEPGFYSVINQAERMEARRLERETLLAEQNRANAEASKARAEAQVTLEDPVPPPLYPNYAFPHRPVFWHPRPHPHHRPPGHSPPRRPASPRTSLGKTRGMRR